MITYDAETEHHTLTGLFIQLQSHSPSNSITNSPNPDTLTRKFLPSINSCVHNCAVTVTLKVAYTRKKR